MLRATVKICRVAALAASILGTAACKHGEVETGGSALKIVNGDIEVGHPEVVKILLDDQSICTGTFVSDRLLLTAAHCAERTTTITFGDQIVGAGDFFIHPNWPRLNPEFNCKRDLKPEFDLAVIRFKPQTFSEAPATVATREPRASEGITIVGYGSAAITPYDRYCVVSERPADDGRCQLLSGTRGEGNQVAFASAFDFPPPPTQVVCGSTCDAKGFRAAFAATRPAEDVQEFLTKSCDGNLDSRGYKEVGVGFKRVGRNQVQSVAGGIIEITGVLGGDDDGTSAASGRGDSGGPLFIAEDGGLKLAGTTSGGLLVNAPKGLATAPDQAPAMLKKSRFCSVRAAAIVDWFKDLAARGIVVPGI